MTWYHLPFLPNDRLISRCYGRTRRGLIPACRQVSSRSSGVIFIRLERNSIIAFQFVREVYLNSPFQAISFPFSFRTTRYVPSQEPSASGTT